MPLPAVAAILARLVPAALTRLAPLAARLAPAVARVSPRAGAAVRSFASQNGDRRSVAQAVNSTAPQVARTMANAAASNAQQPFNPQFVIQQQTAARANTQAANMQVQAARQSQQTARTQSTFAARRNLVSAMQSAQQGVQQLSHGQYGQAGRSFARSAVQASQAIPGMAGRSGPPGMTSTIINLSALGLATGGLVRVIKAWGTSLAESRRPLAEFNGGVAAAFARLDAQRIGRNVSLGRMTRGSTENLTRNLSKLEDRLLPYAAIGIKTMNYIAATLLGIADTAVSIAESIPGVKMAIDKLAGDDKKGSDALLDLSRALSRGEHVRAKPPMPERKGRR